MKLQKTSIKNYFGWFNIFRISFKAAMSRMTIKYHKIFNFIISSYRIDVVDYFSIKKNSANIFFMNYAMLEIISLLSSVNSYANISIFINLFTTLPKNAFRSSLRFCYFIKCFFSTLFSSIIYLIEGMCGSTIIRAKNFSLTNVFLFTITTNLYHNNNVTIHRGYGQ